MFYKTYGPIWIPNNLSALKFAQTAPIKWLSALPFFSWYLFRVGAVHHTWIHLCMYVCCCDIYSIKLNQIFIYKSAWLKMITAIVVVVVVVCSRSSRFSKHTFGFSALFTAYCLGWQVFKWSRSYISKIVCFAWSCEFCFYLRWCYKMVLFAIVFFWFLFFLNF